LTNSLSGESNLTEASEHGSSESAHKESKKMVNPLLEKSMKMVNPLLESQTNRDFRVCTRMCSPVGRTGIGGDSGLLGGEGMVAGSVFAGGGVRLLQ
jgi:hypothetical protein